MLNMLNRLVIISATIEAVVGSSVETEVQCTEQLVRLLLLHDVLCKQHVFENDHNMCCTRTCTCVQYVIVTCPYLGYMRCMVECTPSKGV